MNAEAKRLGMTNSNFGNSNGWPDNGVTVTTARDLATLAKASIEETPELYKAFYQKKEFTWGKTLGSGQAITQGNRNPLLGRVSGADGLKTGHTNEAGYGFTGSAEQDGRRLIMVVAGLGSFNQRIEESVKFMDWGFRAWKAQPLFEKGEKVGEAQVQLGGEDTVPLIAPQKLAVTMPAGVGSNNIRVKVVYQGPLKAPIAKGQHVADLVVQTGDTPPQSMPLVAAEAVGEAGFFGRLWAGLTSLFG
jgi:D-alanyl-D-alanine carboxypeptidase (penicillin-binding protein 5/6)